MRITSLLPFFAKVSLALIVVIALGVTADAVPAVALVDVNRLVVFDTSSPGAIISSGPITGLPVGERLIAIDYRPATGQLYAIGKNFSRLYVINPSTRVAVSTVGNAPFSPAIKDGTVGFDFDPVQDRARIMVDGASRQNLTFAPDLLSGGNATSEALVAFASNDSNAGLQPSLVGLAYDNNFHRASHARLFAIHHSSSLVPLLVSVAPGNGGEVRTIGPLLNVPNESSVTPDVGFDISPVGGHAYVALKSTNPAVTRSRVYTVSLVTGVASLLGELAEDGQVLDLATVPPSLTVYAVNAKNELLKFNSAYPETIISRIPITGMLTGEQLYELDFRIDGGLYGLGRSNDGSVTHFYTVNPDTGVASSPRDLQPTPTG